MERAGPLALVAWHEENRKDHRRSFRREHRRKTKGPGTENSEAAGSPETTERPRKGENPRNEERNRMEGGQGFGEDRVG